jgi:hypothetical protein
VKALGDSRILAQVTTGMLPMVKISKYELAINNFNDTIA